MYGLFWTCFFNFYVEAMRNWYLSRRMFVVDTLSGREKSISSSPKVIRVATGITIRWLFNTHTHQNENNKTAGISVYMITCVLQVPIGAKNPGRTDFPPSNDCDLHRCSHHRYQYSKSVCECSIHMYLCMPVLLQLCGALLPLNLISSIKPNFHSVLKIIGLNLFVLLHWIDFFR